MPIMLPAPNLRRSSLADVVPSCLSALRGESAAASIGLGTAPVRAAIVILIDGLGSAALQARAGHARFLSSRLDRTSTIDARFPTTTASSLATLTTGVPPGEHGLVGYKVRDAAHHRVVNQLSGWDAGMDPTTWQRSRTLFEVAKDDGIESVVIGQPRYRDSGFTKAVLRGAKYLSGQSVSERFAAARAAISEGGRTLMYIYISELDSTAHAKGWESQDWSAQLDQVDAQIAEFARSLPSYAGALVTADHGVLDVPARDHIDFGVDDDLLAGVELVGGEPRCLHLYLPEDATDTDRQALATSWHDAEDARAWVATRSEAINAGWFGGVDENVRNRIGDVIVAARKRVAYYNAREPNDPGRTMIGQHGSMTSDEVHVPLLRLGAFGR